MLPISVMDVPLSKVHWQLPNCISLLGNCLKCVWSFSVQNVVKTHINKSPVAHLFLHWVNAQAVVKLSAAIQSIQSKLLGDLTTTIEEGIAPYHVTLLKSSTTQMTAPSPILRTTCRRGLRKLHTSFYTASFHPLQRKSYIDDFGTQSLFFVIIR